jgi:hypothetical protein
MSKKLMTTIAVFAFSFLMSSAYAQDMKAKKYDDPTWTQVVFVNYLPGKMSRAKEIIRDYFVPASKKAGTRSPSLTVDLTTGEWDMMIVWTMPNVEEMNWEISPDNIKWMTALNEIAGNADKSKAIRDEYSSLVKNSTSYLGKPIDPGKK